jgi:predicted NUDIX family NTP pyrophosphohydrolase
VAARSAGLLLYRRGESGRLELLLAHMGGPYWEAKDEGAWSIVKGEYEPGEEPLGAARREFEEETGSPAPDLALPAVALGELRQRSGKRVLAWAIESDFDARAITSNTFSLEWPQGSGRVSDFPEIDRAGWFDAATARRKLVAGQRGFVDRLEERLGEQRAAGARAHSTSVAP